MKAEKLNKGEIRKLVLAGMRQAIHSHPGCIDMQFYSSIEKRVTASVMNLVKPARKELEKYET